MFHTAPRPSEALEDFFGTETIASLREVVLMPRDIAPVVPDARAGDDVVVLLLARVRARTHVGAVPHTSIVAGEDRMVVGTKTASLPRSEVIVLPGRGHNTLLYDEAVVQIVLDRIRRARDSADLRLRA